MSDTWYAQAVAIIATIHETLPADTDLKARRKALREGKPNFFRTTSWGKKVWARASRGYLDKYDPRKPRGWEGLPLGGTPVSRLDRAKARGVRLMQRGDAA
jgi:hypothetical protein